MPFTISLSAASLFQTYYLRRNECGPFEGIDTPFAAALRFLCPVEMSGARQRALTQDGCINLVLKGMDVEVSVVR